MAPADIRFVDGDFSIAGTDRAIDIMTLAARAKDPANLPEGMEPGLDANGQTETFDGTFPNGCHICEVEVDPETGALELVNYAAANDFGRIVNPVLVDGQVHGGVAQGLGTGGVRELRLRRGFGATALRLVHGLLPAARRRHAALRAGCQRRADQPEPARHQGLWRGRERSRRLRPW